MHLKKTNLRRYALAAIGISALLMSSACQTTKTDPWKDYSAPAQSAPSQLPNAPDASDPSVQASELGEFYGKDMPIPSLTTNQNTTKVALLVPLSGDKSHIGQALMNAAQLAMFDGNMSNFEILPKDTKGTADGAYAATQEAAKDGAQIILGPLFSHSVQASKPVASRYDIPMIAFSTDWRLADHNTYIMGFLPFTQIQRILQYSAAQGYRNVGVFSPQNSYGQAITSSYLRLAPQLGLSMEHMASFSPNDTNISPLLREFSQYDDRVEALNQLIRPLESRLENNPNDASAKYELEQYKNMNTFGPPPFDAVLLPVGGEQARAIANLLSHYDLDKHEVRRLGTGLWDDEALATEQNLEGAWFAAPSPELRRAYEERYHALYGTQAPRLSTLAYDATALAMLLTNMGNRFDRNAITNANGFAGIDGIFRFRNDGLIERGLAVLEYKRGQIVMIDPAPNTFEKYGF